MKDDNSTQKEYNEKLKQDNTNNNIDSPKKEKNESYINHLLSPDLAINQKFFPSKENYFGIKTSPKNMDRTISPSHSPILNYYAGLSPNGEDINNHSPQNECFRNLLDNFSGNISPYSNYSPSNFFYDQNSSKDTKISSNNNYNSNSNEEEAKTLQEKMAPLLRKLDDNNYFMQKISLSLKNMEEKNENQFEDKEDEDEDNEEALTLAFDNLGEELIKEQKFIIDNEILQTKKKPSAYANLINNMDNTNNNGQIGKILETKNTNEKQSGEINILQSNNSLIENIINKKEFRPYIPNNYRNKAQYSNNSQNPIEQQIYTNKVYQNFVNYNVENIDNQNTEQYIRFCKNNIDLENNNKFSMESKKDIHSKQNDFDDENLCNNFYYNGDYYKINNYKEYKKKDYLKTGDIPSISVADIVTTITSNNKKIKRIDPNIYLNESIEYLSYNIFPLAKD